MKIKSFKLPASWKIFWLLIGIAILFFGVSFFPQKKSLKNPGVVKSISPTNFSPSISPAPTDKQSEIPPAISQKPEKGKIVITTPAPHTNSSGNSSQTNSNSSTQSLEVSVSITNSPGFTFSIPTGSTQCDVLSHALSEGKISSLNMRYNNDLGSYGVYQINGIGKDNAIWWTYTVNGQSPSQGCSYIKANNNDKVEWKYIGS